jgi:hypothetical protein
MLLCACPRCYGKRYVSPVDWLGDHQGIELLSSEVTFEMPEPPEPLVSPLVFTGETDDDGYSMQVLVQVFLDDGVAEVAYRRRSHETWSAPTFAYEEQAVVRSISSSKSRHPSVQP